MKFSQLTELERCIPSEYISGIPATEVDISMVSTVDSYCVTQKAADQISFASLYGTLERFYKDINEPQLDLPLHCLPGCEESADECVKVVQFNLLADSLSGSHPQLGNFRGVSPAVQQFSVRSWRLLYALLQQQADVICCEECDETHYIAFFAPILALLGYNSVFKGKTTPDEVNNVRNGVFIASKIHMQNIHWIFLDERKNQVALLTSMIINTVSVCVAVTHLKSTKDYNTEKVRTSQMQVLIQAISQRKDTEAIICADMNANYKQQSDTTDFPPDTYNYVTTNTSLPLHSAYTKYGQWDTSNNLESKEAPYTTVKTRDKRICHTIDYIFHTHNVQVCALLEMPNIDTVPSLPASIWPSDHLLLAAIIKVKK